MLSSAFNIQPVKASETIYIRVDGSIDPDTAPISTLDMVTYTFTNNIYDEIVVERDNIVIDGAGYTLDGSALGDHPQGIDLSNRSNVTFKNAAVTWFYDGIVLSNSSGNTICHNNITNSFYGIRLWSSSGNTISGNKITNNEGGISLLGSSNNTFRNNNMSGNLCNFGVIGFGLTDYIHDIDSSNTVDGKPVYYWINRQNESAPADAGYMAFVNSTNITVKNLDLKNNFEGLLLAYTKNSLITANNITNNVYGIWLFNSSGNSISGNHVTNNSYAGIQLSDSSDWNMICYNNITDNWYGIKLFNSSSNVVHHNYFINNTMFQVYWVYVKAGHENVYDDGYPSGGNYWSDYTGVDLHSGSFQNETGCDGIGDTPYIIDGNTQDSYPLMKPYSDTTPPIIAVLSPENLTYATTSIPLEFAVNECTCWIGYSLNRQANVTITGNTTISGLSDGSHNLTVYTKDTAGNIAASETVYFSINTQPPEQFPTWIIWATIATIVIATAAIAVFWRRRKQPPIEDST